jgi:translation initiation factor 3 subunit E
MQLAIAMKKYYAQKEEFLLLSCFSFWNSHSLSEDNLEKFVEYCTADKSYFSVVQLTFPQLLRYLIVAIALNKTLHNNRTFDLFKLVEVINRKIVSHSDAFTDYISLLHIEYDFEAAAGKIEQCRELIRNDLFLAFQEERIIEGLQFLYFKLACRVYEAIPLSDISKFTGKSKEEAELWILSYIRSGDIEAKIDSIGEIVINNKGRHSSAERYLEVIPSLNTFVNSLSRAIANQ